MSPEKGPFVEREFTSSNQPCFSRAMWNVARVFPYKPLNFQLGRCMTNSSTNIRFLSTTFTETLKKSVWFSMIQLASFIFVAIFNEETMSTNWETLSNEPTNQPTHQPTDPQSKKVPLQPPVPRLIFQAPFFITLSLQVLLAAAHVLGPQIEKPGAWWPRKRRQLESQAPGGGGVLGDFVWKIKNFMFGSFIFIWVWLSGSFPPQLKKERVRILVYLEHPQQFGKNSPNPLPTWSLTVRLRNVVIYKRTQFRKPGKPRLPVPSSWYLRGFQLAGGKTLGV